MVLKQETPVKCQCGRAVEFPEAQVVAMCKCGAIWELGLEGFWSITYTVSRPPLNLKRDEYPRYPRRGKRRWKQNGS